VTLVERLAHYNRQPNHKTTVTLGPDNRPWYTVTDEDGVLIDWFPTTETPLATQNQKSEKK
jgi:hypothetical protein